MTGRVLSVCTSLEIGTPKKEVGSARILEDWGIEGDAHSGPGERQVSLLSTEEIDRMRDLIPDLRPGDFAENIVTQGVDLNAIGIGDRIRIGEQIVLEVARIGKECHSSCRIRQITGECIMPEKGVFARVLKGGLVAKDDPLRIEPKRG